MAPRDLDSSSDLPVLPSSDPGASDLTCDRGPCASDAGSTASLHADAEPLLPAIPSAALVQGPVLLQNAPVSQSPVLVPGAIASERMLRQPEPLATGSQSSVVSQSIFFLLSMATMLATARFAMPAIVEEVRYAWHRGELRAQYETSTDGLKNVTLTALSDAYQMVTDHVGPSVVHIDIKRALTERDEVMAKFLSGHGQEVLSTPSDQGSGVIVDAEGYVLTNRHVIEEGEAITVGLSDGRRVPAEVIATDALTDLALLKINANKLIPIQWADSDACRVGSPVWAVGSPFGLDRTVTFGILSGKHRVVKASTRYQDFMQSDVAVNPGNSGGPLVDAQGQLIGINTAIVGDTYRGVSFSIPSNVAKDVYQRLKSAGRYDRGWLGIALAEVPDELFTGEDHRQRGALVTGLAGNDTPAAAGGLQAGDIIEQLDDQPIADMGHLMRLVGNLPAGTQVNLGVRRDNQQRTFKVVIGARPSLQ